MFEKSIDDRISSWAQLRSRLGDSKSPYDDVWNFWKDAPYVPYNHKINPFHQRSWPTPWDIIVQNKYDDFTKALMIAYSFKLTPRFKNSKVIIKTMIDKNRTAVYNVVFIDEEIAINLNDNGPISVKSINEDFYVENHIELDMDR